MRDRKPGQQQPLFVYLNKGQTNRKTERSCYIERESKRTGKNMHDEEVMMGRTMNRMNMCRKRSEQEILEETCRTKKTGACMFSYELRSELQILFSTTHLK